MKRILSFAAAAICAATVMADPVEQAAEKVASAEEVANIMVDRLQKLTKELANATTEKAFRDASESFRFKDLGASLEKPLSEAYAVKCEIGTADDRAKVLSTVTARFDDSTKSSLGLLVRYMARNEVSRLYWRYDRAVKRVKEENYIKEFERFDAAWGGFMALVKEMKDNKATQVTGSELLVASGLDAFAKLNSCTMSSHASKVASSLDGILSKMTNKDLEGFEFAIKKIREYAANVESALEIDSARCEVLTKRGTPAAMKAAQDFITHAELFVIEANKFADDAEKLVATIRDPSTDIGKLRTLKGFSPNRAFIDPSPAPHDDGHQRYVARIRMALIDAKKAYLAALAVCNKAARLNDEKDIRGWQ